MIEKQTMGNIQVNVLDTKEAIEIVTERLVNAEKTDLFFLNDHCYNLAQKDEAYRKILNDSDLLLNDGIGIEIGAKILGFPFKENLNGTDFIPELFEHLNKYSSRPIRIYLLGAKPGIAKEALNQLQQKYENLKFAGEHHGYYDHTHSEEIIKDINEKRIDILLVGFGMPLQEEWIAANRSKLTCTMTLAVGAFIDFSSGNVTRAPGLFRKMRLEWLYRMLKEPKRLWKRNLVGHLEFFYYVLRNRKVDKKV